MFHETSLIENIHDKQEVLNALSCFTDEDFNGNNGEEYLWEVAQNYESNRDYVLDMLEKSDLTGENLIYKYFELWTDNDGYYSDYDVVVNQIDDKRAIVSFACVVD